MCFKPSKPLNPRAPEWKPTPPPQPLQLIPHTVFPWSYSHRPSAAHPPPPPQQAVSFSASLSYMLLPQFPIQQPYFYYSHPSHPNHACPTVAAFPLYECLNEAGNCLESGSEKTGRVGRVEISNIHYDEGIEISVEREIGFGENPNPVNKARRRAMFVGGCFRVGRKSPARLEWRPKPLSRIEDDKYYNTEGDGAAHSSPRWSPAQQNTTVMIKNIPNQLRRDFMLGFLDHYCKAYTVEYDFLYLPMDFRKENNLGYAFVNFTTASAALLVKKLMQNYKWEMFYTDMGPITSKKICEVRWARIQGKEALINRFKNSSFSCNRMDFLPVVLDPPRNGSNQDHSAPMVIGKLQGLMLSNIS